MGKQLKEISLAKAASMERRLCKRSMVSLVSALASSNASSVNTLLDVDGKHVHVVYAAFH